MEEDRKKKKESKGDGSDWKPRQINSHLSSFEKERKRERPSKKAVHVHSLRKKKKTYLDRSNKDRRRESYCV